MEDEFRRPGGGRISRMGLGKQERILGFEKVHPRVVQIAVFVHLQVVQDAKTFGKTGVLRDFTSDNQQERG